MMVDAVRHGTSFRAYAQITREISKETVLDVFAFERTSKQMIWSARDLTFSRIPRNSLAQALTAVNPDNAVPRPSGLVPEPVASSPTPNSNLTKPSGFLTPEEARRADKAPHSETLGGIQVILHRCLDVPVEAINKEATLEDLDADSLVSSEMLSSLCDRFHTHISNEELAAVTDVESLCVLVTSHLSPGGDVSSPSKAGTGSTLSGHRPDISVSEEPDQIWEWRTTLFNILSNSLEVPSEEIMVGSNLNDLGADSLVAAEILGNVNGAFNLDISTAYFAPMDDFKSLSSRIMGLMGNEIVQDQSDSDSSPNTPSHSPALTMDTGATSRTQSGSLTPVKADTEWIHRSFHRVSRSFDIHAEQTMFKGYWETVYPQQLSTVVAFIAEAFQKLGCSLNIQQGHVLGCPSGVLPKYQRELSRLWDILVEVGVVMREGDGLVRGPVDLHKITSSESAEELSAMLVSSFPQCASTHGLPKLLGPHLAECLTGKSNPVSLLFGSEKGRDLLNDFYATATDLQTATHLLCDFVSAAIRSFVSDDGEPFRMFEIGAGTGGATKHLIPILQATGIPFIYTFTELSVSLLARARKATFKDVAGMEFLNLNIEEPASPDQLLGKYHIVMSSNCVHATRDPGQSLGNIHKLVRPGEGCVALIELTQNLPWYDLVRGLLDGWRLFDDGRNYALQSPWA